MWDQFSRTQLLLGEAGMERLRNARVAIFGIGGVGGYVCEALVRSGIGAFDLVDNDTVSFSNLNRQIIATHDTLGRFKTDVMRERMLSINPEVSIRVHPCFFLPENAEDFPFEEYDYVVDAVDTVTAKIELILQAQAAGVPVISAMGAGNKLDPGRMKVADIYDTKICPLARVMRRELKKRGVEHLKVVYSEEEPVKANAAGKEEPVKANAARNPEVKETDQADAAPAKRSIPGSTAFVPAVCGLLIAGEIVKELAGNETLSE